MNHNQRKAHKLIWILMVIGLPVLMYFSISHRTNISLESDTSNTREQLKADSEKTYENDLMKVTINNKLLHLHLKHPIKSAASLLYALDKDGNSEQILAQLNSERAYVFEVSNDITGLRLFDPVKKIEISKLIF